MCYSKYAPVIYGNSTRGGGGGGEKNKNLSTNVIVCSVLFTLLTTLYM